MRLLIGEVTTPLATYCLTLYPAFLCISAIDIPGYPIMPSSVQIPAVTDTYATISWLLQTSAGFIDNFYVSYRPTSSNTWIIDTTSLPNNTRSYQLTGLIPGTAYFVGVATKNAHVNPSNYTTTTFTTAGKVTSIYGMVCSYPAPPSPAVPNPTGPPIATIYAGIPFNITCNIEPGYQVTWSRVGSSLPSNTTIRGNALVFTNPQPADSGSYVCGYVNSSSMSSPLTIIIISCE